MNGEWRMERVDGGWIYQEVLSYFLCVSDIKKIPTKCQYR
jgi:hypothetical protein